MRLLCSKLRRSKAHRFAEGPGEVRLRREACGQGDLADLTVVAEQAHLRQSEALMADKLPLQDKRFARCAWDYRRRPMGFTHNKLHSKRTGIQM
jgi:hypothetical protein